MNLSANVLQTLPFGAGDFLSDKALRKRISTALLVALLGHAALLTALAMGGKLHLGETRVQTLYTRMISAPVVTDPGLTTTPSKSPSPAAALPAAPARPDPAARRTKPTPRAQSEAERVAAPRTSTASEAAPEAPATASALPD